MEWNKLQDARLAVIAKLATLAPAGYLGRTALMKFCYLIQTVRHVPLGYRFTLYSYGPFDSDVLSDLGTAENLEAVKATVVQYSGGYGYRISKADRAEATIEAGIGLLESHTGDIDWVIAGGESGPNARPMLPEWAESLRDQCEAASAAFFFKQWGEWAPGACAGSLPSRSERTATWWDGRWLYDSLTPRQSEELHRDDAPDVYLLGKKAAGAMLDGREWKEFPTVRP